MLVSHQLVGLDEPGERLDDKLLAILHVVEDFVSQNEVATIDPDVGSRGTAKITDPTIGSDVHQVIGEWRTDRDETGDHVAPLKTLDHIVQGNIREAVAVIGEEY